MDMPRYLELFTSNERALLFTLQTRVGASEICSFFNSQNTILFKIQLIHPFQKKTISQIHIGRWKNQYRTESIFETEKFINR